MAHPACWRQLEQHVECGSLCVELEQRPLERQQQYRVPPCSPRRRYQEHGVYGRHDRARAKRSLAPPRLWGNIDRTPRPVRMTRTAAVLPRKGRMKTVNTLWHTVIDFDALHAAYKRASKGKRYQSKTLQFSELVEENLMGIHNHLVWGTYQPLPLREFTIREPKERKISAPEFRDRVIHHALVAAIEPVFERKFIADSFACRKGKGMHESAKRLQHFTRLAKRRWGRFWVCKIDMKKYFASISHERLKTILRRAISDRAVLSLCDLIIDMYATSPGAGLPIGALTSQLFANVYLDQLDHYCKEELRHKYYARYMDDVIILAKNKHEAKKAFLDVKMYCNKNLNLEVNSRSGVWPGRSGVDFCGYRIWPTHIKPRKRTVSRAKRRLSAIARRLPAAEAVKAIRSLITSFTGYMRHCSCRQITSSVLARARRTT